MKDKKNKAVSKNSSIEKLKAEAKKASKVEEQEENKKKQSKVAKVEKEIAERESKPSPKVEKKEKKESAPKKEQREKLDVSFEVIKFVKKKDENGDFTVKAKFNLEGVKGVAEFSFEKKTTCLVQMHVPEFKAFWKKQKDESKHQDILDDMFKAFMKAVRLKMQESGSSNSQQEEGKAVTNTSKKGIERNPVKQVDTSKKLVPISDEDDSKAKKKSKKKEEEKSSKKPKK